MLYQRELSLGDSTAIMLGLTQDDYYKKILDMQVRKSAFSFSSISADFGLQAFQKLLEAKDVVFPKQETEDRQYLHSVIIDAKKYIPSEAIGSAELWLVVEQGSSRLEKVVLTYKTAPLMHHKDEKDRYDSTILWRSKRLEKELIKQVGTSRALKYAALS